MEKVYVTRISTMKLRSSCCNGEIQIKNNGCFCSTCGDYIKSTPPEEEIPDECVMIQLRFNGNN